MLKGTVKWVVMFVVIWGVAFFCDLEPEYQQKAGMLLEVASFGFVATSFTALNQNNKKDGKK